jgi:hypothetical protein
MPGSPKKRARREAAEREKNLAAGKAEVELASAARNGEADADDIHRTGASSATTSPAPAVPIVHGEVLPPGVGVEPTRTALKRAMRARAQEHAEAAIAVLVGALASQDERVRLGAANDLLAWGFGKPAQEIEAGEGAQMIVIRRFGEENT